MGVSLADFITLLKFNIYILALKDKYVLAPNLSLLNGRWHNIIKRVYNFNNFLQHCMNILLPGNLLIHISCWDFIKFLNTISLI